MAVFFQGEANKPVNSKLQLFIIDDINAPLDSQIVGFRIVDVTTERNKCYYANQDFNNIQVFPTQGTQYLDTTNLTTDVTPGHKISTGHYYAPWSAGSSLRVGEYVIIWEWKINVSSPTKVTRMSFSIIEC